VQLVSELGEARHALNTATTGLAVPASVRRSLAAATLDAQHDEALRRGTARIDARPYRQTLAWLSTQESIASNEYVTTLNDLTRMPTASSTDVARRIVGFALIVAVASISMVLFVTWRRSRRFEQRSSKDALTGIANRRQLDDDVTAYGNTRVAVLMIDIDHFKMLNDTAGHAAGDHALVCVAKCLASAVRSGDLAYRYGGEEFCVLLPDADLDSAKVVAERIRSAVEDLDITGTAGLPNGRLTVSIGVAVDAPQPAITDADRALYAAKNNGRNRVTTTTDQPSASSIAQAPEFADATDGN
jgi:diguanylate cyclase (GGDEF)-like protein